MDDITDNINNQSQKLSSTISEGNGKTPFRDLMKPDKLAMYNQYWGKINSKVTTVAIDTYDGNVYNGISGLKNNPTRSSTNKQVDKILKTQGQSYTNYPLDNCSEFNAINNALNGGSDISNLKVYSVDIKSGQFKTPCDDCKAMYSELVDFIR